MIPSPQERRRAIVLCLAVIASGVALLARGETTSGAPAATLRLAQVVTRLPKIYFYAVSQDEAGVPVASKSATISALVGNTGLPVQSAAAGGIAMVFLVDVSASLNQQQFDVIRASVLTWIDQLGSDDRAAVVTLGSQVRTVQDFTADKQALKSAMAGLAPKDQNTLLYQGVVQAIDLSHRLDGSLPPRRAILVLTDGLDDQEGGAGRQEVVDKLGLDPVPIYGIGASRRRSPAVDAALKDFAGLARLSGGDFRRVDLANVDRGYTELHRILDETVGLTADCPRCVADGSAAQVRLLMADGAARLSSQTVTVRMLGADGRVAPELPNRAPRDNAAPAQPNAGGTNQNASTPGAARPAGTGAGSTQASDTTDHYQASTAPTIWQIIRKWFFNAPAKWSAALAAVVGGLSTTAVVISRHKPGPAPPPPPETAPEPSPGPAWIGFGVYIANRVTVAPGTDGDKRRLRLQPLGRNELSPIEVLFEDELKLGRGPDNDIRIDNDAQVSAAHCTLAPKGQRILVRDLRSSNGTRINGVPVPGFLHADADAVIGIGRTELRMKVLPGQGG